MPGGSLKGHIDSNGFIHDSGLVWEGTLHSYSHTLNKGDNYVLE